MAAPAILDGRIAPAATTDLAAMEDLEGKLLDFPQVECPVTHTFAPGVYMREVFMPAGSWILGHCHKTEHLNVILTGRAKVMMDGVIHDVVAPCTIKSGVGVRKLLYIEEDMRWATIHPTTETDLQKLEDELIIKSDTFINRSLIDQMKRQIERTGVIE